MPSGTCHLQIGNLKYIFVRVSIEIGSHDNLVSHKQPVWRRSERVTGKGLSGHGGREFRPARSSLTGRTGRAGDNGEPVSDGDIFFVHF